VKSLACRLHSLQQMPSDNQQKPIELHDLSTMDRIRSLFKPQQHYEPIEDYRDDAAVSEDGSEDDFESREKPFSHIEYWIFLLMGVAMLWAW
jgi:hypothetical protein